MADGGYDTTTPTLECPACKKDQDVKVGKDTYHVQCEHCGTHFDIPKEHQVGKRDAREWTSRVNIKVEISHRPDDPQEMGVAWTVKSAEKGNRCLEKKAVEVDVSSHPDNCLWHVAVFKCLQYVGDYKEARIWVKHDWVVEHLAGEREYAEDDPREMLRGTIVELASEKFLGCEFSETNGADPELKRMARS